MSTVFDLTDKVAIVTGGIGYGIARGLAAAGASIVVAARQPGKTAQAVTTKRTRSPRTLWLCQPGNAKDKKHWMAEDFDASLKDFKEYRQEGNSHEYRDD
jgi:NAD(P)-dependent dehydrogenase (short-subunit alcohol dehydrogenase family)